MSMTLLLDTGPLVALLVEEEPHHEWARQQFGRPGVAPLTCEAVIAEACFLVDRISNLSHRVLMLIRQGAVRVSFDLGREIDVIEALHRKYADTPMSLADACLVRMSELHEPCRLLTFDSDFEVYRRHGRKRIPLLRPDSR